MMEKIKVSNDIFYALNHFENRVGKENFKKKLNFSVCTGNLHEKEKILYSKLQLDKMVDIAYFGYELELTTEEIIADKYKELNNEKITDVELGFMNGIKFTLDSYGYKIKGVND